MHVTLAACVLCFALVSCCDAATSRPAASRGDFLTWTPGGPLRLGDQQIPMPLADGATLAESPAGPAAVPNSEGLIASAPVGFADHPIPPQGTIELWVKLDRPIRVCPPDESVEGDLLACDDLRIRLREQPNRPDVNVIGGILDRNPPGRPGLAGMDLTHLRGDQWYHIVIRYDAPKGLWRMILSGVLQPEPWFHGPLTFKNESTRITFGGLLRPKSGRGEPVRVSLGPVRWRAGLVSEAQVRKQLEAVSGWQVPPNRGEGVLEGTDAFDAEALAGEVIYRNDFSKPLDEGEWVLEGPAKVSVQDGRLAVRGDEHSVLWLKKPLPRDFVATWDFQPSQADGLTIVFFSAMGADGRDLFDPALATRDGDFQQYIRGDIRSYHCSYWAGTRGSANMRKNPGFYLIGMGPDLIGGPAAGGKPGPFRVTVCRRGNRIDCAVDGRRFLQFEDDGRTYGPVHGGGYFGLRQMGHSRLVYYDNLVIRKIKD